jgi:hypothetical protein
MTSHYVTLPCSGEELEIQAEWSYTPEDPASIRGPGCNEQVEVEEVWFGKCKLNLPTALLTELEDEIMTNLKNYDYADFA